VYVQFSFRTVGVSVTMRGIVLRARTALVHRQAYRIGSCGAGLAPFERSVYPRLSSSRLVAGASDRGDGRELARRRIGIARFLGAVYQDVEYSRWKARTLVSRDAAYRDVEYSRWKARTLVSLDAVYQDIEYSRRKARTPVSLDMVDQDVEYSRLRLSTLNG